MKRREILLKQMIDRVDARLDAWGEALKRREFRFPSDLTAGIVFALVGIAMLLAMPSQVTATGGDVVDGRAFPTLLTAVSYTHLTLPTIVGV